jgi:hypothetical protein
MIRRIFNALVFTANIRHGVFPTAADTFAAVAITLIAAAGVWTKGAWIQIVLAAGVTADTNIWGFTLENFVGAASQGEVEIGIGTAPLGTMLGVYQITAAGYLFSKPLRVPAGNGIVARYRTSTGVADTVDIKLNVETGF